MTLLIACGNTLRQDDGVGWRLAERVEAWHRPDLEVRRVQQLTPELAPAIAAAERVLFVDAAHPRCWAPQTAAAGPPRLRLEALAPAERPELPGGSHAGSPQALLELAERLYGRRPPAWRLLLEARQLGFGGGLSAALEARLPQALATIAPLLGHA
jgi:hydrogenase maturation protease